MKNSELKKYIDSISLQPKSILAIHQNRKSNSKSKNKKSTPRSPLHPNRILRSYNSITNQVQIGPVPFTRGVLNKTLNPKLAKKSLHNTLNGINSSMHDLTNKSAANCMINNLYFIPKTVKS